MALALNGCTMSSDQQEKARISQDNTPLPVDPSDKIVIGPWWSDGTHLLNLRDDGGYTIYDHNNRYSKPIDRGRWGRQNYATLWLEPYTGLQAQRIRVQVVKAENRFGLNVPKYQTMFALATPPAVLEDQLVGDWQGEVGVLTLKANLTYVFAPASGATAADGKPVVGHNGKWKLSGERITLNPTTPSVSPQSLAVKPVETAATDAAGAATPTAPTMEGLGGTLAKSNAAGS